MYNPSQEQIRTACLQIQKSWNPVDRLHRRGLEAKVQDEPGWLPPVVRVFFPRPGTRYYRLWGDEPRTA